MNRSSISFAHAVLRSRSVFSPSNNLDDMQVYSIREVKECLRWFFKMISQGRVDRQIKSNMGVLYWLKKPMQMSYPEVLVVCGPRWLITNWKLCTMKAWDLRPRPSSPCSMIGIDAVRSPLQSWWYTGWLLSTSLYMFQNHPNNCRHESTSHSAKPPKMIWG